MCWAYLFIVHEILSEFYNFTNIKKKIVFKLNFGIVSYEKNFHIPRNSILYVNNILFSYSLLTRFVTNVNYWQVHFCQKCT